MFKRPTRWMTAAVLVIGALTACSEGTGPTEVSVPVVESPSVDLIDASLYESYSTYEAASLYTWTTGATLVTTSQHDANVAVAIIGPSGGEITAGEYSLEIPQGAVAEATAFRMEVVAGSYILVDLSAQSVASGEPVSVFPVPLKLTLSYKGVVKNSDVRRLRNVYLVDDSPDLLFPLLSVHDKKNKTISSPISHFSLYGMAIE